MRRAKVADERFQKMKAFFESNEVPQEVTKSLKNGAVAEVEFEDDPNTYVMVKEGDRSVLRKERPEKRQIYLKYYGDAVDYLVSIESSGKEGVQEYAARFSECILDPTPIRRIEFKLCCNVVTASRMGYFGMMLKGGKTAINLVTQLGIKIPKKFLSE
jgi:hypothetical protein